MRKQTNNRELTRAELEIMQILWDKGEAFVNDIIDCMDEPKPAYNTVSTIVRILERKEFVGHHAFGKSHKYFPLMSKEVYTAGFMNNVLNNFFDNSVTRMMSFFTEKEQLSMGEMEEIMTILAETRKQTD